MRNKVLLIGMRGCGKSHFGTCLSQELGWPKIDMDDEIELLAKKTIPNIVKNKGWDAFRDMEHDMAKKVSKLSNVVISAGGGAITFERNQKVLKNNKTIIVFLFASFDSLVERLEKKENNRPELQKGIGVREELKKSWEERKDIYFEMSDLIFYPKADLLKNSRKNVEKNAVILANRIKKELRR